MKLMIGAVSISKDKYKSIHEEASKVFDEVVVNTFGRPLSAEEIETMWVGCDAILAGNERYTKDLIEKAPSTLKVISKHGVGVDSIDLEACRKKGITVCNTPGANAQAVAEAAVGFILSALRKIPQAHMNVVSNQWKRPEGNLYTGKTLGVIGMGNIGKRIIKCSEGFDVNFMAYDPYFDEKFASEHNVKKASIDEILTTCDIITLHVPVTEETAGMINKNTLSKMKKNAILINTARGDLVNEEDLYEALKNKVIAGAALDVLSKEPCYDSPLFTLDNIIVAPHLAGNTVESTLGMGMKALENAIKVVKGQEGAIIVK